MVSDYACALACLGLYGYTPMTFDYIDLGEDDGICWALKRTEDVDIVVLRGSVTFRDWIRDFVAWANPLETRGLGPVHPGFMLGMEHMWGDLRPMLQRPTVVTGHSLGAARASILAGLMTLEGKSPVARVVFGEPKPGFEKLKTVLSTIPGRSYRNGHVDKHEHDLITAVPFSFPPQSYVHPTAFTDVFMPPDPTDAWGPFRYHHMQLYCDALKPGAVS